MLAWIPVSVICASSQPGWSWSVLFFSNLLRATSFSLARRLRLLAPRPRSTASFPCRPSNQHWRLPARRENSAEVQAWRRRERERGAARVVKRTGASRQVRLQRQSSRIANRWEMSGLRHGGERGQIPKQERNQLGHVTCRQTSMQTCA